MIDVSKIKLRLLVKCPKGKGIIVGYKITGIDTESYITVDTEGEWNRFKPSEVTIAEENVDYNYLVRSIKNNSNCTDSESEMLAQVLLGKYTILEKM